MAGALQVTKFERFAVGDLVQRGTGNPYSGKWNTKEGTLKLICRSKPGSPFSFVVEWNDGSGTEILKRRELSRSKFADFPLYNSPQAQAQTWQKGNGHYWVSIRGVAGNHPWAILYRLALCLHCQNFRTIKPQENATPCIGKINPKRKPLF